ncbi:peptidoglycan-binding domain-containing protein [Streptomyces endophyticus]|uniref:Peptidoglycan-binding protein n=1 Tax=Streptomyces endophyticus TaxID=714166 RepID=A0ABU6FIP8_9ACTN|nr:peptidoglycan-binding domain-containing protein [Streptomyces endophyticus]MEB8343699.1 peptidoglycan-binding protein [Streptomyces endophyticus]
MSEERRTCPECGTGEGPDGAPPCACEPEAFAPLRVRPYVSLSEPSQPIPPRAADPYAYPPPPPHAADDDADGPGPDEPARHGRMLLLSAVTGVLSVATLVTVLITSPGDDGASASDNTAATATATTPAPSRPATPTTHSASPPAKTSPSASPSPTHSRTVSASPTATGKKPDTGRKEPDRSPSPSASRSTSSTPTDATTLRRGDSGREVVELQWRLKQLNLYVGEITGDFDSPTESAVGTYQFSRGIKNDPHGEYGPATRTALERETGDNRGPRHG